MNKKVKEEQEEEENNIEIVSDTVWALVPPGKCFILWLVAWA